VEFFCSFPDSITLSSATASKLTSIPSLNKMLVLELARSEYVTRRENIIAVGNSEPAS
jgi:hypothetical protein